ncbi:hypothetical protein KKC60_05335 [Patescibacteria group bacterium]|nr:hypothetical protein [Patescibacteria group bacterium]
MKSNSFDPQSVKAKGKDEEMDFVKTSAADIQIETMPTAPKSKTGKKKKSSFGFVLPILIVAQLILAGVLVWYYRDTLGLKDFNFPFFFKEETTVQTNTRILEEGEEGADPVISTNKMLQGRIEELEKKSNNFVTQEEFQIVKDYLIELDSDGDGFNDFEEIQIYKTDPKKADTDGDGFSDKDEVDNGYNPNGEGELEKENGEENEQAKSIEAPVSGSYVGSFSLTDQDISSNDLKFNLSNSNVVTGSFTFERNYEAYRVDYSGQLIKVDNKYSAQLEAKLLKGTEEENLKIDMELSYQESVKELGGSLIFKNSQKDFLNNQSGEVSLKKTEAPSLEKTLQEVPK